MVLLLTITERFQSQSSVILILLRMATSSLVFICQFLLHSIFSFCLLGMFAIRADREYVVEEDFMKAVRKVADNKKLESKLDYKPV